jgi:hypothetical protein
MEWNEDYNTPVCGYEYGEINEQKFKKGDRVYINVQNECMKHFPTQLIGTVEYSCWDCFWNREPSYEKCIITSKDGERYYEDEMKNRIRQKNNYSINIDGYGSVAWYDSEDLLPIYN